MIKIEITDLGDKRAMDYAGLTEAQLRSRINPAEARIIVESPKVIATALESGLKPLSILCEEKHIAGDARDVISMADRILGGNGIEVLTSTRKILASLTGYTLTRGVLCSMRRPEDLTPDDLFENKGYLAGTKSCESNSTKSGRDDKMRVGILDGVCDSTNIGAIFRSAAALGIDAMLLTRSCCDPFCRRSIRVSMGTVFQLPWCWIEEVEEVRRYGFKTLAMALRGDSISMCDNRLKAEPRLGIIMGTEGDGLSAGVIHKADYVVKIPMHRGVDSLNVAAASAVAFWELASKK